MRSPRIEIPGLDSAYSASPRDNILLSQRRKGIGIRMALGARKIQVLQLVLREGATLVLIGSILGLGGAMAVGCAMAATLNAFARFYETTAKNLWVMIGVPLLLAGLAMLACFLPARRAAKIDPIQTVREE